MRKEKKIILYTSLVAFVFLFLVCFACSPKTRPESPRVFTGIPPLLYFVKKLLGKGIPVESFLSLGNSPVTFEPPPSRLRALRRARLFFLAGVPMERAFEPRLRNNFPGLRIVDLQSRIPERLLLFSKGHAKHGDAHYRDPHFWLSPKVMSALLPRIADELAEVFPERKHSIRKRQKGLSERIQGLHKRLESQSDLRGRYFVVQHPSWGYFARDYGLHMISIEEQGVESNPANFRKVLQAMKAHHIRHIIVQPEFAHSAAKTLATELGAKLVFLSPLSEDWEATLLCLSQSIRNLDCKNNRAF